MTGKEKAACAINLLVFVCTAFATASMIIGFTFMGEIQVLSAISFRAFRYFTVDSNVFAGIVSLVYSLCLLRGNAGRKAPELLMCLKLAATTGVTLTMAVTMLFLAPRSETGYFSCFMNSNLFMHLITPLLCIVSFVFLEPARISLSWSCCGVLPMLLYALYYIPNILLHLEDGQPTRDYDWYGFLDGGLGPIGIVLPLMLAVTWLIALGLRAANKKGVRAG